MEPSNDRSMATAFGIPDTISASSWSDTEECRGEIRRAAQQTLKQLSEKQG